MVSVQCRGPGARAGLLPSGVLSFVQWRELDGVSSLCFPSVQGSVLCGWSPHEPAGSFSLRRMAV